MPLRRNTGISLACILSNQGIVPCVHWSCNDVYKLERTLYKLVKKMVERERERERDGVLFKQRQHGFSVASILESTDFTCLHSQSRTVQG
jgi:hypothetical protein